MKKFIIIFITSIILFLLIFSVIFAVINISNNKIMKGIKVDGINVSDLNIEEAREKLKKHYEENNNKNISLFYESLEENIPISVIVNNQNIEDTINEAYKIGRSGNIIQNNYSILNLMIFGKNLETSVKYNEEEIDKKIEEVNLKLPGAMIQSNYYIENNQLIIKKGSEGIQVKKDELKKSIIDAIKSEEKKIIIPTQNTKPNEINIGEIHKEIYKEAKDASVTHNPTKVNPEVNGVDFKISIEEAKKLLNEDKDEYIIPLKITIPKVTINKLGEEAFADKLGEFTTRYDASHENRSINLTLASNKINGTVILPGETFSYNKVVGERTISKGYKEAAVYAGGKVVQGIGGGICQLSSTLYNAVVYANLEITKRSNHMFTTSYVEIGRDATVSWGTLDFCFKNTRSYPVKIVSSVEGGVARVGIYGIYEEKEYDVSMQSVVTETIPYTTNYIDDDTLEKGVEVVSQNGSNGAKSITYKIVRYNGIMISKTVLSTDTYSPLEKIIKKGTKEETQIEENIEKGDQI